MSAYIKGQLAALPGARSSDFLLRKLCKQNDMVRPNVWSAFIICIQSECLASKRTLFVVIVGML